MAQADLIRELTSEIASGRCAVHRCRVLGRGLVPDLAVLSRARQLESNRIHWIAATACQIAEQVLPLARRA